MMKPTVPYIRQKFDAFNRLCFEGKLPEPPITLSHAKGFVGICRFKKRRRWDGSVECYDFRLSMNERMDLPEAEWEDTILHEMIHYYIGINQLRDTSAHGRLFRQMMESINSRFGRHITVSHKTTAEQREQAIDQRPRWHVVAVAKLKDGRTGIKVIPRIGRRVREYRRGLLASGKVASLDFFLTDDPFFNRFPSSSALKVYFLDPEEVSAHLAGASPLNLNPFSYTCLR